MTNINKSIEPIEDKPVLKQFQISANANRFIMHKLIDNTNLKQNEVLAEYIEYGVDLEKILTGMGKTYADLREKLNSGKIFE